MRENFNNHRPRAPFDEGRNLDTGEIDSSGARIFDDTDKFINIKAEKNPPKKIEKEKTVCKYCGQDPCSANCDYR